MKSLTKRPRTSTFARPLTGARARGGFLCFPLVVLEGGGWVANFYLKEGFVGSSEPGYLNSLNQHSMILSLTTIELRPFLNLGPTCPWPLGASSREAGKEPSVVVASHVWNDSCLLLPKT